MATGIRREGCDLTSTSFERARTDVESRSNFYSLRRCRRFPTPRRFLDTKPHLLDISCNPDYPLGVSTATVEFIPRQTSSSPSTSQETPVTNSEPRNLQYLYSKHTELTTSAGLKVAGTKQYIFSIRRIKQQASGIFCEERLWLVA